MILLLLALQVTPVQPMPKGTALPPPGAEEAAVLAPIERMLAALTARDAAAILAQVRPEGAATAVVEQPDGTRTVRTMTWPAFAAGIQPRPERLEERLIGPAIEIDGDVAMVWSPYVFTIDGKLGHCGTNHFSLVRDAGGWKVANIAWTQRTTDCPAP